MLFYLTYVVVFRQTQICNYIFTSIFLLEAVIRFIAQGKNYLKKYWNIFDLVIVATAVLGKFCVYCFFILTLVNIWKKNYTILPFDQELLG